MKIIVHSITENPVSLLRRAGYTFQHKNDGEMSFIRSLARSGYPRFHVYARVDGSDLLLSFHLDHKKETYGEQTRHHGAYKNEGPLQDEATRLIDQLGLGAAIIK